MLTLMNVSSTMHAGFKWRCSSAGLILQLYIWISSKVKFPVGNLGLNAARWWLTVPQGWVRKKRWQKNDWWQLEQLHLNVGLWHCETSAGKGGGRSCTWIQGHFYLAKVSNRDPTGLFWSSLNPSIQYQNSIIPSPLKHTVSSSVSKFAVCLSEGFYLTQLLREVHVPGQMCDVLRHAQFVAALHSTVCALLNISVSSQRY